MSRLATRAPLRRAPDVEAGRVAIEGVNDRAVPLRRSASAGGVMADSVCATSVPVSAGGNRVRRRRVPDRNRRWRSRWSATLVNDASGQSR